MWKGQCFVLTEIDTYLVYRFAFFIPDVSEKKKNLPYTNSQNVLVTVMVVYTKFPLTKKPT
jgi:hypothetical protein